ncbi:hypothetical protein M8C21_024009 [Ambrosia artemisiifolia]|uniref:F-box domain-containing protein n=1 Tax=Ambrosia artemisiifolia TaxID=4212 RepID=A0AAD5GY19_AMBAR|nr:hypothetical protein M8C21_024009 [Ambrosia artemisiifolia]
MDSDHQSTDPGSLIGSNDDLLTQILLRLPAASILRFKSVSKHWLWLLSYKHFTQSEEDEDETFVVLKTRENFITYNIHWMRYYRSFYAALSCEAACFIQIMTDEDVASGM